MAFCSFGPIPFIIDKVGKTHRINNNTVIPFKVASTPSGECDRSYSLVHNPPQCNNEAMEIQLPDLIEGWNQDPPVSARFSVEDDAMHVLTIF